MTGKRGARFPGWCASLAGRRRARGREAALIRCLGRGVSNPQDERYSSVPLVTPCHLTQFPVDCWVPEPGGVASSHFRVERNSPPSSPRLEAALAKSKRLDAPHPRRHDKQPYARSTPGLSMSMVRLSFPVARGDSHPLRRNALGTLGIMAGGRLA